MTAGVRGRQSKWLLTDVRKTGGPMAAKMKASAAGRLARIPP